MSLYQVKLTNDRLKAGACGLYRGRISGLATATVYDSPSAAKKAVEAWQDGRPERAGWVAEVVALRGGK